MSNLELEFIDELFSSIDEDSSIRVEIKPYLMSLKVAVITISEDKSFFTKPTHPARVTLLLLACIASGHKPIRDISIVISEITDRLIHSSNIKTDSFVKANRKLLKMIENEDKNRIIMEYESIDNKQIVKSKKDNIRKQVLTDLNKIILDNQVPRLARDLILKVWPHFMVEKSFNKGVNASYRSECIEKFKAVIGYLQPIKNIEQWLDVNDNYKEFISTIYVFLNDSNINPARISVSTSNVQKAIAINLNDYKLRNPDTNSYTLKKSNTNVRQLHPNHMTNHLKPGQWYDIYTKENLAANRLKLSVILKEEEKLIFVDHKGIKGMEKSINAFLDELAHDLSRPVNVKSSLKDTWNDLISRIPNFNR